MTPQEWAAAAVAAVAALYVLRRLTGWPRRRPPSEPSVVRPEGRLARGLDKAARRRAESDPKP